MSSITFSTCWYNFKAKFDPSVYYAWIDNMLSNVNNYNLVVFCDIDTYFHVEKYRKNDRIMIIVKRPTEFYTYQYQENWISNHEKNTLLNYKTDWKLNMLWSEKINFVRETMQNKYFNTDYYGWCDIGYFRGRPNDLTKDELRMWPNTNKIRQLDPSKIYYACVNNDKTYIRMLAHMINEKSEFGLPETPIHPAQISIAGGFFISHKNKLEWWHDIYYKKLDLYFRHNYLVKDDQIILADCVFSDLENFQLCLEDKSMYDNWFMFQRLL
jgi:hypothetical protein